MYQSWSKKGLKYYIQLIYLHDHMDMESEQRDPISALLA